MTKQIDLDEASQVFKRALHFSKSHTAATATIDSLADLLCVFAALQGEVLDPQAQGPIR